MFYVWNISFDSMKMEGAPRWAKECVCVERPVRVLWLHITELKICRHVRYFSIFDGSTRASEKQFIANTFGTHKKNTHNELLISLKIEYELNNWKFLLIELKINIDFNQIEA